MYVPWCDDPAPRTVAASRAGLRGSASHATGQDSQLGKISVSLPREHQGATAHRLAHSVAGKLRARRAAVAWEPSVATAHCAWRQRDGKARHEPPNSKPARGSWNTSESGTCAWSTQTKGRGESVGGHEHQRSRGTPSSALVGEVFGANDKMIAAHTRCVSSKLTSSPTIRIVAVAVEAEHLEVSLVDGPPRFMSTEEPGRETARTAVPRQPRSL